ncbi:pitrilysin family protein [Fusobacterium sp.]|uniref:M16 family metallopeptidase n=1 Tax=Fusobacterium sp. TaxID=68766 RepID=UPI00262738C4|nr:pitrilysin family protein [Fusobacterium sp.]
MSIKIEKLKNGIPVLMDKIEGINSVTFGIFVKTGAKNELSGEEGISHLLEHMMFKGTKTKSAKEISEIIDNEGGIINAYTGKENTVYYVQMLSNKLKEGIEILTDMFLNSTFSEENLEKEKNVVIEEIRMYDDIPEEIVHDRNTALVIDGVQGNIVLGTEESIKGITREKLIKYFKEQYRPENIVISIAGNFSFEDISEILNNGIGKIENIIPNRDYNGSMKIKSIENRINKDTNQVHLCFNTLGCSLTSDKRYEVAIISNTLAGNMSSRLFQKIREDRGLAYSVFSYTSSFEEGGLFTVYAGTTKKDYQEVLNIIENEFEDIKENGITEYELQKSKNQFLSAVTFGLESSKGRMNRMANSYLLYKEVKDLDEILKQIEKITVNDIKRVAQDMFDKKYYSKTILGNI